MKCRGTATIPFPGTSKVIAKFPCHFKKLLGEGMALAPGNGLANRALWSFSKRFIATVCWLILFRGNWAKNGGAECECVGWTISILTYLGWHVYVYLLLSRFLIIVLFSKYTYKGFPFSFSIVKRSCYGRRRKTEKVVNNEIIHAHHHHHHISSSFTFIPCCIAVLLKYNNHHLFHFFSFFVVVVWSCFFLSFSRS